MDVLHTHTTVQVISYTATTYHSTVLVLRELPAAQVGQEDAASCACSAIATCDPPPHRSSCGLSRAVIKAARQDGFDIIDERELKRKVTAPRFH